MLRYSRNSVKVDKEIRINSGRATRIASRRMGSIVVKGRQDRMRRNEDWQVVKRSHVNVFNVSIRSAGRRSHF